MKGTLGLYSIDEIRTTLKGCKEAGMTSNQIERYFESDFEKAPAEFLMAEFESGELSVQDYIKVMNGEAQAQDHTVKKI